MCNHNMETVTMTGMTTVFAQSDIQFEFNVPVSADLAYSAIGKVKDWWIRDSVGEPSAFGSSFTVHFNREQDFVRFEVTEAQPGRRYVWHVQDCFLHWFEDKMEWNGTDVIFDIAPTPGGSVITMVHRGLTPDVECYAACNAGWEGHVMKSLYKLITEGAGTPQ
jgi:hypothetical protein